MSHTCTKTFYRTAIDMQVFRELSPRSSSNFFLFICLPSLWATVNKSLISTIQLLELFACVPRSGLNLVQNWHQMSNLFLLFCVLSLKRLRSPKTFYINSDEWKSTSVDGTNSIEEVEPVESRVFVLVACCCYEQDIAVLSWTRHSLLNTVVNRKTLSQILINVRGSNCN